jgi:hypothetical protein
MKFLKTMLAYDVVFDTEDDPNITASSTEEPEIIAETASTNSTTTNTTTKQEAEKFLPTFIHIIQFLSTLLQRKNNPGPLQDHFYRQSQKTVQLHPYFIQP